MIEQGSTCSAGYGWMALWLVVVVMWAGAPVRAADDATSAVALDVPYTQGGNVHYVGNREPLLPSPLIKLPVGSVEPRGWLRTQLVLMADGLTGRLSEISMWCRPEHNAWADPHGQGEHGWEEMPYWLKGQVELGHIVKDERIIAEATAWIDRVLGTQDADGWIGWQTNKEALDLWPNMVVLYALRSHFEATGDERIVPAMLKYFRFLNTIPPEKYLAFQKAYDRTWWQSIRGGDNLDIIHWLYNQTGEAWLLDLARKNHAGTAPWVKEIPNWHGVNITQAFREPGQFYQQSHDQADLAATIRNYDTVMGIYGQVPGGMFGADENAREGFIDPRQAAETCSHVEFMYSHELLMRITGNTLWADRCEEIAFNMFPATQSADLKALRYLTAPNMAQADRAEKTPQLQNRGQMIAYDPYEIYRCCQHNVSHGWPYFTGHLWCATQSNGLAATMYAPSQVTAKVGEGEGTTVTITETTDYPFSEKIIFEVSPAAPVRFPLLLRVPGTCERAAVHVNGMRMNVPAKPGQWIALQREWKAGDRVELDLPALIRLRTWARNGNSVSVHRGPLLFSLQIGEQWKPFMPEANPKQPPRTEAFQGHEVLPTTPWNYALSLSGAAPKDFELIRAEGTLADQPFTPQAAPMRLKGRGARLPDWKLEPNGATPTVPVSPVASSEPIEEVILIPAGCARLRIMAFPVLKQGE